jgi:hypothetical protein
MSNSEQFRCSDPGYRRSPAWPCSDGFFSPRSPNGVAGEARGDRLENTDFRGGLRRPIPFLIVRRARAIQARRA